MQKIHKYVKMEHHQWVKEEITTEILKYFEINENEAEDVKTFEMQ